MATESPVGIILRLVAAQFGRRRIQRLKGVHRTSGAGNNMNFELIFDRYLTAPIYSPGLTPTHLSTLKVRPDDSLSIPPNTPRGPCSLVAIAQITTVSHPAFGQSGLFATKALRPGSFILQYLGEIHSSQSTNSNANSSDPKVASDYDLSLDREQGLGIDADGKGNEARFINDYRGVADRPNAEFKEVWDEGRKERGMGVWVLPEGKSGRGKGIGKGEEILVSYGRGFWSARKHVGGEQRQEEA